MKEPDCLFCKIAAHEIPANIIYEDDLTIAILDIEPVANGHSLVFPKNHFADLMHTDEASLLAVTKTRKLVAQKINSSTLQPKGFNYLSNQGKLAKQVVMHYHEHILPKYEENKGFKPDKNVQDLQPIAEVFETIKNA